MSKVIRVAGSLLCFLLWACCSVSSALAQIEIDLGPQEVLSLKAEEPEAILGLAAQQMDRGEAAMALATVAQGLARYPDDPKLLERQADIYATQPCFWQRAADLYKHLLARRPGDMSLLNKLATIVLTLRRLMRPKGCFRKSWQRPQTTLKPIWVWAACTSGGLFTP